MNSNRGQYNASPLYNLKNKQTERKKEEELEQGKTPDTEERHTLLSLLLSIGLPVLFLVCLMVPNATLRWVFLGLTGVSVLAMWLLRAFVRSARNTLTVIYAALSIVVALALFISRPAPDTRRASAAAQTQPPLYSASDEGGVSVAPSEMNTPAPEEEQNENNFAVPEAEARLDAFFQAWIKNSVTEIKEYCLPSWVNEQQSAETELFQKMRRSRPIEYSIEDRSGGDAANSRIITVKAAFDDNGETVVKRMRVIMRKINDVWYVDPNSLDGVKVDEAAEAAAQASSQMIASTIAPTAEPKAEGESITVYYNVHGGKYYHTTPTCSAVDSSYWPLTGEIPFELINSKEYSKLIPCTKCGAPARPAAY
ncbi:MAG: hypothetical protein IKO52_06075 [Clostridia bacterium]|nr:hypothetical protein [Clostridia bacterium]